MQLLIEASESLLAGAAEEDPPVVGPLRVEFNGKGAAAHEPFIFPGGPDFNFCKTFGKPYDSVVVACLLVARDHFPADTLKITSDGQWSDWSDGAALYRRVLGRSPSRPAGVEPGVLGIWGWLLPLALVAMIVGPWQWRARHKRRFQPRGPWRGDRRVT